MHSSQFYFSVTAGSSIAILGALLASGGIIDWSLFTVGCGISALALVSRNSHRLRNAARVVASSYNNASSNRQAQ